MIKQQRFSIVLPVRNGGDYFKECVSSILNQTNRNFDLIILDNASTDGSLEWIRSLNDLRIKIYESKQSLSIEDNWARIVQIPKNEFMTIIGHDDLLDPNYLNIMGNLIHQYPDAGLYQAHFRLIDANGTTIRSCNKMPLREEASAFLEARFSFQRDSFGTGYMFRSSDYEKVGGIPAYRKLLFSDDALWVSLMIRSYKATSADECFSYRVHNQSTSYAPDRSSLLDALADYLVFLKKCSLENEKIAQFLNYHLSDYILLWFQWAYFYNAKESTDKTVIRDRIDHILRTVSDLLDDEQKEKLIFKTNKFVLERFSYVYWLILRYQKRIINIFLKVKKTLISAMSGRFK